MPLLLQMPIAAEESAWMLILSLTPKSAAKLCRPQPSLAPCTTPASSASPELSVTTFCVTLHPVLHEMLAAQGASAGGAPAGRPAAGKVGVREHLQVRLDLPGELVHQAGRVPGLVSTIIF